MKTMLAAIEAESVTQLRMPDDRVLEVNYSDTKPMFRDGMVYVYDPMEGEDFYMSEIDLEGAKMFKLTEVTR